MENNDPFKSLDNGGDNAPHLIESLEKKLYAVTDETHHKERTILHPKKNKVRGTETWEEEEGSISFNKTREHEVGSPFVKFFLFSLVFFVIAVGIAGYSLFSNRIVVSPNNVKVSVFGPVSVKGGEELSVQVLIENKNTVPLNNVQLATNFPSGSRYISKPDQELPRTVKKLESVLAGEVRTETVKALILGGENEKKEIAFEVRFSIEGSDALYTKTEKFLVNLTTPPLSFTTTLLSEIMQGQEFVLGVDIKSNSQATIKSPIFKIEYPQGFVFKGATPAPTRGDNYWMFDDMVFGDTKHIEIRGNVLGENGQQKIFHLSTGTGTMEDKSTMRAIFSSAQSGIKITESFLGIGIFVNGIDNATPILNNWKSGYVNVQWTNNLVDKVNDGELEVSLIGNIINKKSVLLSPEGFYDAGTGSLLWDKRVFSDFASMAPGQRGRVSFNFSLLPYTDRTPFKNPVINISTSVKGTRINENNVPTAVKYFSSKTIKVSTEMKISSFGTHYGEPIENTGPIPPKVGQETTYTITWKATNTANDVSEAEMSAVIPLSVHWTGKVFPNGAPVSYNQTSKKVIWKLGDVKSGVGYLEEPAQVSFQVSLLPGLSQFQKTPALLLPATLTATDDFTKELLSYTTEAVTTIIVATDPKIKETDTQVTE